MKDRQKMHGRRSQEQIGQLVAQYHQSGQSKARFARTKGIQYHTFLRWLRESAYQCGFSEVKTETLQEPAFAEVQTRSGALIRFLRPVSAQYLLEVAGR